MQTKKDRIPTGFLSFFSFVTSLKEISIIIDVWLSRAAAVSHIWGSSDISSDKVIRK